MSNGQKCIQIAKFFPEHPVAIVLFPPTVDHNITTNGVTRPMKRTIAYIAGQGFVLVTAAPQNFSDIAGYRALPAVAAVTRFESPKYHYKRAPIRTLHPAERAWCESMIPTFQTILTRAAQHDRNTLPEYLAGLRIDEPTWLAEIIPFEAPKPAEPQMGAVSDLWANVDRDTQESVQTFFALEKHNSTPAGDRITVRLYRVNGTYTTYTMAMSQYRALEPQLLPSNTPFKLVRKVRFDRKAQHVQRVLETHVVRVD
jgi:hypothetical protein